MIREHDLKIAPTYFDAVGSGEKPFEVRRDDRGFQRGDTLVLRRWGKTERSNLTGYLRGDRLVAKDDADTIFRRISYILTGGQYGIEPGFVVLGLEGTEATPEKPEEAEEEDRGYRAGVEAAESVAQAEKDRRAGLARNPVAAAHHASGFVAALAIVEGIRSLTPEKPKEAEAKEC